MHTRESAVLDKGVYWIDPEGGLHLTPHPGQLRAIESKKRIVIMSAGTQGGKTSLLPFLLYREILRMGRGDYLAGTATSKLFQKKFLPEMLSFFEGVLKIGRFWAGAGIIEICDEEGKFWARRAHDEMWARILVTSAQTPGGFESSTANAAILDELGHDMWQLSHWEGVLRRLSIASGRQMPDGLPAGRIFAGTTLYNLGWLRQQVYLPWLRGEDDSIDWIEFASVLNPAFPREEYERARERMDAWRFAMFYEGRYANPPGLVYSVFDENKHVVEGYRPEPLSAAYVGVDFGGANTAILWIVRELDELYRARYVVFDEMTAGGISIQEHVRRVHERARSWNVRVSLGWGGAPSEGEQRRTWTEAGLVLQRPSISDVETGISNVIRLFHEGRLVIDARCRNLLHQISTYSYEVNEDTGEVTGQIRDKNKYHLLDALRYGLAGLTASELMEVVE